MFLVSYSAVTSAVLFAQDSCEILSVMKTQMMHSRALSVAVWPLEGARLPQPPQSFALNKARAVFVPAHLNELGLVTLTGWTLLGWEAGALPKLDSSHFVLIVVAVEEHPSTTLASDFVLGLYCMLCL